jgi:hypothetical protein
MHDEMMHPLLERDVFPMVKVGPRFELVGIGPAREAQAREGGYERAFLPFLARVLTAMRGDAFVAGSYFPGGWYRALLVQGVDPLQAAVTPQALAPFYRPELRVDGHGRWFSGDKRITGRVLRFFLAHLRYEPAHSLYCVRYPLEQIEEAQYLRVESPPFRAQRLEPGAAPVTLRLNDGTRETLRAETLWMDSAERLYCSIKFDAYPEGLVAAVDDPARWDLLGTLEDVDGHWFVRIDSERRAIPVREGYTPGTASD